MEIAKNIFLMLTLTLLGACSTSGLIASDVDLKLTNVVIKQSEQVREGAEFSHLLREEIFHQFAKTNSFVNEKKAALLDIEVKKLRYPGNQTAGSLRKSSIMAGVGVLIDQQSGSQIGTFKMRVSHKDERYSVAGLPGRKFNNSHLIQLMAQEILKKVYGNVRAKLLVDNPSQYVRRPYFRPPQTRMSRNHYGLGDGNLGELRLTLADGVLPPEFIGPPMEPEVGDGIPKVINAPHLPIQ